MSPVVRRVTTKPYVVPNSGGRVTLEPGSLILVPVHALHHDGAHFAAPEAFQPQRFPGQLSAAYMPYGSGPQSYIGEYINYHIVETRGGGGPPETGPSRDTRIFYKKHALDAVNDTFFSYCAKFSYPTYLFLESVIHG